ncbi:hypothetical protein V1511DRAFT_421662 [Dipodascopsis uninucleata]
MRISSLFYSAIALRAAVVAAVNFEMTMTVTEHAVVVTDAQGTSPQTEGIVLGDSTVSAITQLSTTSTVSPISSTEGPKTTTVMRTAAKKHMKRQSVSKDSGSPYRKGDLIPVECLSRELDHGEHITDEETGELLYEIFPMCSETGRPLEIPFGLDIDNLRCTISLTDPLYHLWQIYVHQDAPLSCKVGKRKGATFMAPLSVIVSGKLEQSHLDVSTRFALMMSGSFGEGSVFAGGAFSPEPSNTTRVIIGDELPLVFNIRWFDHRLPRSSDRSLRRFLTFFITIASALVGAMISAYYMLVVVFPLRLRRRQQQQRRQPLRGNSDYLYSKTD